MAYYLLNIETSDHYSCDDRVWIEAIDTAKRNYWEPDGTRFDAFYDAADQSLDGDDEHFFAYMLMIAENEALEWDGSYIKKRNQVVIYEDTIYLAAALEGSGVSPDLIEFIKKGSFRICSE
jgi:hypothetical protein